MRREDWYEEKQVQYRQYSKLIRIALAPRSRPPRTVVQGTPQTKRTGDEIQSPSVGQRLPGGGQRSPGGGAFVLNLSRGQQQPALTHPHIDLLASYSTSLTVTSHLNPSTALLQWRNQKIA